MMDPMKPVIIAAASIWLIALGFVWSLCDAARREPPS